MRIAIIFLVIFIVAIAMLVLMSLRDNRRVGYADDYLLALSQFPGDTTAVDVGVERFADFYRDITPESVDLLLDQTYADRLYFNDTLHASRDRQSLKTYMSNIAGSGTRTQVELYRVIKHEADVWVQWRMTIRFAVFGIERVTDTVGMSQLRFDADGKIILQQDFWDSSSGFFEAIPGVGSAISLIKSRF